MCQKSELLVPAPEAGSCKAVPSLVLLSARLKLKYSFVSSSLLSRFMKAGPRHTSVTRSVTLAHKNAVGVYTQLQSVKMLQT